MDLSRGMGHLARTKNGEPRSLLPLARHARELLQAMAAVRRPDSPFVFPSKHGRTPASLRKPWERALSLAGITNFRFHNLRHTAASYLAMTAPRHRRSPRSWGTKTLAMVKRYAHLSESPVSQVVARNESLFTLASSPEKEGMYPQAPR